MPGQLLKWDTCIAVVDPDEAPAALAKLERAAVVIQIVARQLLGATGPRNHQVVPFGDADVDGAGGLRGIAPRLRPKPVAINVPGMDVVGAGNKRADHQRIAQKGLQ